MINLISNNGLDSIKYNYNEKINQFTLNLQQLNNELKDIQAKSKEEEDGYQLSNFIDSLLNLEKQNFTTIIQSFQYKLKQETDNNINYEDKNKLIDEIYNLNQKLNLIEESISDLITEFKYLSFN